MGKSSKAPSAPDPYATASAESQFNRLDTYGADGSGIRYGYTDENGNFVQGQPPEGQQAAQGVIESDTQRMLREMLDPASVKLTENIINDNIDNMPKAARVGDRGDIAQDIFDRNYSLMEPNFKQESDRMMANLQARGIPVGSEAFNETYAQQQASVGDTLSRLSQDANIGAGQEQSRQFGLDQAARSSSISELVAAMGGGYSAPSAAPSGNAPSVNYTGAVNNAYQADMANHQNNQAQQQNTAQTVGQIASIAAKSDRRLKRDIVKVGKNGPFNVYQYRYLWDAAGTMRYGYMAQEILLMVPSAVIKLGEFMSVDYAQLPEIDHAW